jgi:hypothetical protein
MKKTLLIILIRFTSICKVQSDGLQLTFRNEAIYESNEGNYERNSMKGRFRKSF